jgi:hypothetical protein
MRALRFISTATFFVHFLVSTVFADSSGYDPSNDLMSMFQNSCPSFSGAINQLADAQSSGLEAIITNMRNDPACSTVAGVVSQIQGINISQYTTPPSVTALKTQVQDIQAELANEKAAPAAQQQQDATYIATLQSDYVADQQSLVQAQGALSTDTYNQRYQTIQSFAGLSGQLFTALQANPSCANKYNIGAQVGSQILAASSGLATGFMAPILLATGSIFSNYMQYLRDRPLAHNYKKVMNARIQNAAGCAIEGISSTFCQARDLKRAASATQPVCQTDWTGGKLISQDLPSFVNWINRINAGSNATSTGVAADKGAAEDMKDAAQKMKISLDSDIAMSQNLISAGSNTEAQEAVNLLSRLSGDSSTYVIGPKLSIGAAPPTPILAAAFQLDPQCGVMAFLYTSGASYQCFRGSNASESCLQCVQRLYGPKNLTIASLQAAEGQLVGLANSFVSSQTGLVEESSPLIVLSQFTTRAANNKKPLDFVLDARAYLSSLARDPEFQGQIDQDSLNDLKVRLDKTLCVLAPDSTCNQLSPSDSSTRPEQKARLIVNQLHDNLIPSQDTAFVGNAMYDLVKKDLDNRIEKHQVEQNLADILQFSSSDTLGAIVQAYMGRDQSVAQANNAQGQTIANLDILASLFGKQIKASITTEHDPTRQAMACIRAATLPNADRDAILNDISSFCAGKCWTSVYPNLRLCFDDLKGAQFENRVCAIYDFYRKSSLLDNKQ